MSDSYVTSKATLKCSCGDRTAKLTVYPDRTVDLTEKPMANISDHISLYNIAGFGRCHTTRFPATGAATAANHGRLTPMPCIPGTVTDWVNGKDDYIIRGNSALLKTSYCRCKWGGIITIVDDGQVDTGSADLSKEGVKTEEEMKAETEEKQKLDPESVLDGIQLALDAAGLAPGVGAIPDLLNASISAIRGDWAAAGLSVLAAVPVIGDAATAAKFAQKGVKMAKTAKKAEATVEISGEQLAKIRCERLGIKYDPKNSQTLYDTAPELVNEKIGEIPNKYYFIKTSPNAPEQTNGKFGEMLVNSKLKSMGGEELPLPEFELSPNGKNIFEGGKTPQSVKSDTPIMKVEQPAIKKDYSDDIRTYPKSEEDNNVFERIG